MEKSIPIRIVDTIIVPALKASVFLFLLWPMNKSSQSILPVIILGVFYVIFGSVTWLNSILIPYLKIACQLNNFESLLVAFAFYISYFIMALPSSWILSKTGFKKGMMLGLFIMAMGMLIFLPAGHLRIYGLFLAGLFVIGIGLTILQAAVNPYVTIVGPIESAARRMSIMGICNKVAGVLGPMILGAIILSDADTVVKELQTMEGLQKIQMLNALASRVILPYSVMAVILLVLGFLVQFSPLPEIEQEHLSVGEEEFSDSRTSIFQFPNLVLGVVALFFYVGVEVISVDTIVNYGFSSGIALSQAKSFAQYTLYAMIIGYVISIIVIPKYLTQAKALSYSVILGIILSIAAVLTSGYTSVLFIASLGIANAVVWPAIWPLAIHRLGRFTKLGSALLIMAIVGGAVLSPLYGLLADNAAIGHKNAYWMLVPCYLFILFYSLKGHRFVNWNWDSDSA
jgi:glucose/galactose transporter